MSAFVSGYRVLSMIVCLTLAVVMGSSEDAMAQDAGEGGSIGGRIAAPPSQGALSTGGHKAHAATGRRAAHMPQAERAPRRSSERSHGGGGFDGSWSVSAGGPCSAAGTNQVVISGGHISGQGVSGTVSRSGSVQTVGNINGLTVIGRGRISGNAASGSYKQSDGCSGPWSGYKL